MAAPERAAQLARAPNVKAVRRRRDGAIMELQVFDAGGNAGNAGNAGGGSASGTIHNYETETNPPRVWEFKQVRI